MRLSWAERSLAGPMDQQYTKNGTGLSVCLSHHACLPVSTHVPSFRDGIALEKMHEKSGKNH